MGSLAGKNVLLGVSGGIAAYKAPDLVRRLRVECTCLPTQYVSHLPSPSRPVTRMLFSRSPS